MRYLIILSLFSFLVSCEEDSTPPTPCKSGNSSAPASTPEPKVPATPAAKTAYTNVLQNHLLTLSKGSLINLVGFEEPTKYYLFYKTASWCPPCRKFTPYLVSFYNEYKAKYGNQFEIILLTSDNSYEAMERYAKGKKMGWPHLAPEFVPNFNAQFRFPGSGIPNLVLTDIQGNIIQTSYATTGQYFGPAAPMQELQRLLDNQ